MTSVRILCASLVGLFLIFLKDNSKCCIVTGFLPPKPNISQLKAISDKQSLVVSWLGKRKDPVSDIYEIQISRTEKHTIIYSTNVSVSAGNSSEYTWTWISDLPLECADHSVRIRNLCNQSVASPWSNWITNYGVKENVKSKIFPIQRVLMEGTSAIFCCVPPQGVNITSMNVGSIQYPLMSIGARVKAVTVHNLTISKTLIKVLLLTCTEATGKENSVWNYISFPPQKPRNLSCATSDRATINCTWDSGRKRDPFDKNIQTHTLHIQNSNQAPIKCTPLGCTFPVVPQMQEYNISVVVKDMLGEEMESYSFNIADRVFPVLERVRVNPGVADANVSWSVMGNLTQMNLLCQVSTIPDSIIQLSCNSSSGLCKVTVDNLHPGMGYFTRVRCSVDGKFWGAWTQPTRFTTCPLVTLDLWRRIKQLSDSHIRHITLLWSPHVVSREAVNIQGYTLQWSHENQIQTELKDSEQRQTEVSIGPGKCEFTVQAVLRTGSSIPVRITIPPLNHTEIFLVRRRLKSTTAGGFSLSWDEQSFVTCGYTVEWCILGSVVPCTVQWLKLPKENNTVFLPAEHFKAGRRYSFHIYGCTENGHKLLEIQTGYSQELKSVQSPSLVYPVQSTSSSVTLEWHYNEDDPALPAFIIGYLVKVQEVGSDMLPGQAANCFEVTVADPLQKSVTFEGLHQNQEYICSISALTKEGPGIAASITIRTRRNYFAHIAKILIPILLLLACAFVLWPQRKMLKSGLREIFVYPAGMNIKTPEFDNYLYEMDQRLQSQRVEDCICCDIEILNIKPLLDETTTIGNPELTNTLCSTISQSALSITPSSCVVLQTDYHPQAAVVWDRPTPQQMTCITNKSYLHCCQELP
ncbi:leukemia inhibitory factor receptor [Melanotaenia boesemani]|uniref:leukemia inhibitory factor receptor n=1 Tax=Melanotaenia boesemani TaxID=1250792 RepID=UPI001C048938|nr:leukemia inhibitory factor receptor [Melanotaenia boesemani]